MRLNKYIVFALIFFFLNSVGLPLGLTYTALLSPFFYGWILLSRKQEILMPFFICLLPFTIAQLLLLDKIDNKSYLVSVINLATVYVFCQAFYTFLKNCRDIEKIFRTILILNFILCLIAIPLFFTPYYDILWIQQFLTSGVDSFRRLKLFTYEASYYATLFVPLFFFYFLILITGRQRSNTWLLWTMILLPYLLSFSLGVISAILITIIVIFITHATKIIRKRGALNFMTWTLLGLSAGVVVLGLFFPGNTLFLRLSNIFSGNDTSGRGRTTESFLLAGKILDQGSLWWGIGPGQIKVLGAGIIRRFYNYPDDYQVITIPNAVAETWTLFGIFGLAIRFTAEITLFFHRKVWTNYYRLALFIFIFIYQFTGSFVTNLAEYVIWILAFTEIFPQFDVIRPASGEPAKNAPKFLPWTIKNCAGCCSPFFVS